VNGILQTFQAVYLVQYERFIPSKVPENPTFMTVSERFMTVSGNKKNTMKRSKTLMERSKFKSRKNDLKKNTVNLSF
jgi:hypothetical protein